MDHNGQLLLGNVEDSSFEDAIINESAKERVGSVLGHRPLPTLCKTCDSRVERRVGTSLDSRILR